MSNSKFVSLAFFIIVNFACNVASTNKAMPILINNNTSLDLSALECFSCKMYLSDNLYSDPLTKVHAIDKDAVYTYKHPNGTNRLWFGTLTVKPQGNDSLWMNIEVFSILHTDTLRILNFGGRTIPNDTSVINNIKNVLCRFLNK
jgi:hypothetical protein